MRGRGRPGGGGGEGGRLAALLPFSAWLFSPSLPGSSPHPSSLLVLVGRRGRGRPPWGNLPWGGRAGRQPLPHGDPPAGDSCRWQCSWRLPGGRGGRGRPGGRGGRGRPPWALLLSPPWALLLSPPWALLPSPAWYSRPDYRSVCWSRCWGDTHARRRYARPGGVGRGGRRAAAAAAPVRKESKTPPIPV